ncbi:MAG TPA: 4-hydroxy-tetrahydrodipicolinate synthase [Bdellovibrionota bacterium]|nr:4-hydroxy-tetrahydrodipicolinate synthase [Bdellovibrionota bacterium]
MFEGVLTAIVTPFRKGVVDEEALRSHIEDQIAAGIHGLVPCGTTGESPTLSPEEQRSVIKITIDQVKKRVVVIPGTGNNNTKFSLEMTQWAKANGADGALVITPYYNKPPQRGLYEHFKTIATANIPLVLYNVPSRTNVSLEPSTLKELEKIPNIVALKEATGSMELDKEFIRAGGGRITLLSGDDATFFDLLEIGGKGCISVASNIVPQKLVTLFNLFLKGKKEEAKKINQKLMPLMKGLFIETNPIPVKHALSLMGKMTAELRLPLVPMEENHLATLKEILRREELIS